MREREREREREKSQLTPGQSHINIHHLEEWRRLHNCSLHWMQRVESEKETERKWERDWVCMSEWFDEWQSMQRVTWWLEWVILIVTVAWRTWVKAILWLIVWYFHFCRFSRHGCDQEQIKLMNGKGDRPHFEVLKDLRVCASVSCSGCKHFHQNTDQLLRSAVSHTHTHTQTYT